MSLRRRWLLGLGAAGALAALAVAGSYALRPAADARASCARPAARIVPEPWARQHMRPGSALYEAVFSPQARARVLADARRVPVPYFSPGPANEHRKALRSGRLIVSRAKPAHPLDAIDWASKKYGLYYATQLHSLGAAAAAVSSDKRVGQALERRVGALVTNWALCAAHNPEIHKRAWFEGTVVKRQSTLLHLLAYLRRTGGSLEGLGYDELMYLIVAHADYLLDTPGIHSDGNHGVRQDLMLAATALMLPSLPRAPEMLEVAQRRLNAAAKTLFTAEGIWLEHAPGYVHYALRLMLDIGALAEFSGDFAPREFLAGLDGSARYLARALTPQRTIPWIGISPAQRVTPSVAAFIEKRTGATIDQHIARASRTLSVYPGYGHAVFRGADPAGLYLIFYAGQNLPAGKRHEDALSFILVNHGRVWITEGGHGSVEGVDLGEYLLSPYAHNTYVHGERHLLADARPDLRTSMREGDRSASRLTAVGTSRRFPTGAMVTRSVQVDDFRTVRVRDELSAPAGEERTVWRGFLHFPHDLEVSARGRAIEARDPQTRVTMKLEFSGALAAPFVVYSAQASPPMGWGQTNERLGPVHTVEYRLRGSGVLQIAVSWVAAR
jgi:hypothetical protein